MRASFVKTFSAAAACSVLALAATTASAQETKLAIGISGWTGYAPLSLAQKEGIFKKHGLDVDIKMIPQKDRHLALASNSIQCAATTVQTHMAWTQMGVPITQIFLMDKSTGADGLVVRDGIKSFADLKGKTIAVDATGTTPYFMLASMLKKNGMSLKDVKLSTLSPQAAAQAFANAGAIVEEVPSYLTREMIDGLDHFWRVRSWGDISKMTPDNQAKILPYIYQWAEGGKDLNGAQVYQGFAQIEAMRNAALAAIQPQRKPGML